MAAQGGDHVYATLLLNDTYLPGALVLAHSLRDARTTKKLAVMVTLDSVSAESITQLKAVYDYIFPVPRIQNSHPANLYLMNRADLHSAFTKINLWKFTEFSKIVYIDADIVAYRAPDELFDISHPFSAAPDIGWPDLFNTGVMALTPNMGDYYAMMAMADRGISFDGADQGLINMHFRNDYNRLSFTYNVTPSAHYQYLPAYRHFQSSINMVHFIGSDKPWFTGRHAPHGNSPYDEMVGRWWAVYDRHFRVQERAPESSLSYKQEDRPQEQAPPVSEYVQYFTKGEFNPQGTTEQEQERSLGEQNRQDQYDPIYAAGSHPSPSSSNTGSQSIPQHHHYHHSPAPSQEQHGQHHNHHHHHQPYQDQEQHQEQHHYHHSPAPSQEHHEHHERHHEQHHHEQGAPVGNPHHHSAPHVSHSAPSSASDSSQHPGTQAEARSEQQVPEHSHDGGAPPVEEKKPEPPPITMNNWDAQRQPPPADSKPEAVNFPSTHYEMSRDTTHFVPPERYPSPPRDMWYEVPKEKPAPRSQPPVAIFPWEAKQPKPSRYFAEVVPEEPPAAVSEEPSTSEPVEDSATSESATTEVKSEPSTPATPTLKITPADPWSSFSRVNAWDEMPEIERYVEGLPWHQRVKSQEKIGRSGGGKSATALGKGNQKERQRSFKLTDFPSELERPSLPVTPAPIRRPTFWGGDDTEHGEEGSRRKLPEAEGVPTQSDWDPMEQLKKLAEQQSDLLLRKLGGDEEEESSGVSREIPSRPLPFGSEDAKTTAYVAQSVPGVLSPQPVKGKATTSILRNMGGDTVDALTILDPPSIPKPSYSGPGAAWERGEDFMQQERPMPPNEEDRDVLDT